MYKYFAVKYKLRRPTGPLSLSLSSSDSVAANGEITEVMDLEKEETMKNCSLAMARTLFAQGIITFSLYQKQ